MKKINYIFLVFSFMLCASFLGGCASSYQIYKVKELDVSPAVAQGLNLYSYDEILDQKVTIRQPIMQVLERGLPRIEPEVLSDTFTLPNSEVSITFPDYPGQNHAVSYGYNNDNYVGRFEKYMLLRQAEYYSKNAQTFAEEGLIKKHPAADLQYGEIPVENNAVRKRIITDPDYKRSFLTSGLYLPAGETATVKISGLKAGESVQLVTQLQQSLAYSGGDNYNVYVRDTDNLLIEESKKASPDYSSVPIVINGQYARQHTEIPYLTTSFTFSENKTYKIGSIYGGPLHINCSRASTPVQLEIEGCVETPHFILGVTSEEEFEQTLRNAPGLICTLDTENGQLVGPSRYMRNTDDILKVAYMWHSTFAINISYNGQAYNYTNVLKFDRHVPAGAGVALDSSVCAMPEESLGNCLNFSYLKTRGEWLTLHELGHTHSAAYGRPWGMNGKQEGEVRNNALITLNYLLTCNIDPRITGIEHGEVAHPYTALQSMLNISDDVEDFEDFGYFSTLSLYSNLMHQFSPQKFVELLYSYSRVSSYATNPRADFAFRMSVVYGQDFRWLLNEYYKANLTSSMFTQNQLLYMSILPKYYPIACYYSNGVGESESAPKQIVSAGGPTEFEFDGRIVCPKNFTIIDITSPQYGKIERLTDTKVKYIPPTQIVETDQFDIVCLVENGLTIKLPIRLRLEYNYSFSEIWQGIGTRDLDEAIIKAEEINPTSSEFNKVAGKASFNSGKNLDYVKTQFNYIADEDGKHRFYLKSDDIGRVIAVQNNQQFSIQTNTYTSAYSPENYFELELKKNEVISFTTHLINTGGAGSLNVGVKKPSSENAVNIPVSNIILSHVTSEDYKAVKQFGWKPVFVSSIKNFTRKTYLDRSLWSVIEAPIGEGQQDLNLLFDGNLNTIFHSKYSAGDKTPMPHTYVLDMGKVEKTNFFEIGTRSNANSYIKEYQLYSSVDGKNYTLLSEGEALNYVSQRATLTFETVSARYFKLIAKSTTGKTFSVLSELNAGIIGNAEQIISPNSQKNFMNGFNSSNEGGGVSANTKGSALVINFKGTQFNIFANKDLEAGRFAVYIDGKFDGEVDLSGQISFGQLVYVSNKLNDKNHTVEIITLDDKEVEISYMSIAYGNSLLNAANIYKEKALGISLGVFCTLFVLLIVFIVLYFTVTGFRNYIDDIFHVNQKQAQVKKIDTADKTKTEKQAVAVKKTEIKTKKNAASKVEKKTTTVKKK